MGGRFAGFASTELHGWPVLVGGDPRFKTFRLALVWQRPLDRTLAARALLPALLQHGTARWPDRPALARAKERAFGAHAGAAIGRHAETAVLWLQADAVARDFLPGRPDQFAAVLELLDEYALRPRLEGAAFPAEVFRREQAQALAAARAVYDDKAAWARQQALALACAGEPYGLPEHGGEEAIAALDAAAPAAMLEDFRRGGRRLCIAVGVLPEDVASALEPLLARLPGTAPPALPPVMAPSPRPLRRVAEDAAMQQAKLVLVFRTPPARSPAALCALQTCLGLWGGGPHSRLFREVRERRSLCYYAAAGGDPNKGLVTVQVGCEGASAPAVVEETVRQLAELQQGRFGDDELATTLASIDGSLQAIDDSQQSRLHFTVEQWLRGFDEDPSARRRRFATVTRDDLAAAARSIWFDLEYALLPAAAESAARAEATT